MKKNYVYFIAPLVAVVIFGAVYWNFLTGYEKEQDRRAQVIKDAKKEKLAKEERDKKQAYDEAIAGAAKRKAEKDAKDAKDAKDREDRQAALDERDKVRREELKLADKVKSLSKDIAETHKEIDAIEADKKKAQDEAAFLKIYVKQAEANRQSLLDVLDKIQKAEDAAAAAAKAAAAAAKK